jgi:hypothetical protein
MLSIGKSRAWAAAEAKAFHDLAKLIQSPTRRLWYQGRRSRQFNRFSFNPPVLGARSGPDRCMTVIKKNELWLVAFVFMMVDSADHVTGKQAVTDGTLSKAPRLHLPPAL